MEGTRRCPICDRSTDARLCPKDKIATLLIDAPGIDVASVRVGQIVGDRYVVERKIGKGGFGAVFAARHTGTGQEVALKCLNTAAGVEDVTLRRFFQEARVTSGLAHPNTIRVFDFGQDDSGLLFIAMELLSGRTLKQELTARRREGRVFTEEEAINVAVGILRSLAEAHGAGLVHRDLKPDNIFLHEVAGEEPIIKVLDFGIVKLGDSTITLGSDSGVPGTPAFMSPEQVTRQSVDGRSDLYSLGCLLYQLVTGKVPLRGESAMQTLYMHVHDQAEDVRLLARTPISDEFAAIVHRALAKDPDDRFDSAKAMRLALEVCRGADPSSSIRSSLSRGPTRLTRDDSGPPNDPTVSERASLFTGPGFEEVDASVPDISKHQLPPPRQPKRSYLAAVLVVVGLAAFGAVVVLKQHLFAVEPPVEVPARSSAPPPVSVAPPAPVPEVETPPPAPAPALAEDLEVEEEAPPPERQRVKRRLRRKVNKKIEVAPPPPKEPAYEILDEKI